MARVAASTSAPSSRYETRRSASTTASASPRAATLAATAAGIVSFRSGASGEMGGTLRTATGTPLLAYLRASRIAIPCPPRPPRPSRVRRRSSGLQTRAEIVATAERHFAERGFEAARLEDIAAEVGIRRAAIFYHFGDKQELYAAVLDEVLRRWTAVMPTSGSAVERLEASLTGWIDYVAQRPSVARLILREAANARPGVVSPFVRAGRAPVEWFRALIDEGVASGELEAEDRAVPVHEPDGRDHGVPLRRDALAHARRPFDPWSPAELEKHKREILLVARTMLGIERGRGPTGAEAERWTSRSRRSSRS